MQRLTWVSNTLIGMYILGSFIVSSSYFYIEITGG
jgi:hypothetical protein